MKRSSGMECYDTFSTMIIPTSGGLNILEACTLLTVAIIAFAGHCQLTIFRTYLRQFLETTESYNGCKEEYFYLLYKQQLTIHVVRDLMRFMSASFLLYLTSTLC